MVKRGCQGDIGVGKENMRGDKIQMGEIGWVRGERLPVNDGGIDALLRLDLLIGGE
jgi:hypothetical protein